MAVSYRHTQVGYVTIAALGIGVAMLGYLVAVTPTVVTILMLIALITTLVLFATLTVTVERGVLDVWFGPGAIRRRINLSDVRGVRVVRNPWYSGWGVRWIGRGWLWNVSGFGAVELELSNGRRFRIGSDEPETLAQATTVRLPDYNAMLKVALNEARQGLAEGGIPIGAALFTQDGELLGAGHNRRLQENDPSVHAETDAFRKAGRQRSYRDKVMVTTLAPCWYCSGLIRQFKIGTVVVGESENFAGGIDWLRENGIEVIDLRSRECMSLLADYISKNSEVWNEDIGEE